MALRAGYYGLKRFERNKLLDLAASIPADIGPDNPIASKSDISATVDLLKDTTGWTGKNKQPVILANIKASNTVGTWNNNVYTAYGAEITVNNDGSIKVNGTPTTAFAFNISMATDNPNGQLLRGKYVVKVSAEIPQGCNYSMQKNDTSQYWNLGQLESMTLDFTDSVYWSGRAHIYLGANVAWNNAVLYPIMYEKSVYDISPAFEPYHESVEEMLIDNCKIHRYSFSNDTNPKSFLIGNTPLMIIAKHNGGDNISVFFVVSSTDTIATIADVGNKFTLTKDENNVYTITSSEAYWSLVFIGDTIPTVTNVTNREISAEPEVKETKKVTKKKVIKEEEE